MGPGTELAGIDLRNADLKNVDLAGANLTNADLENANLNDANLIDVIWSQTTCPDALGYGVESGASPHSPGLGEG